MPKRVRVQTVYIYTAIFSQMWFIIGFANQVAKEELITLGIPDQTVQKWNESGPQTMKCQEGILEETKLSLSQVQVKGQKLVFLLVQ